MVGTLEVEKDEPDFVIEDADGGDGRRPGRLASEVGASLAPVEWRFRLADLEGVVLPEETGGGRGLTEVSTAV